MQTDIFVVVCWPEIQSLMEDPEFLNNALLINSNELYEEYGSSSYMVRASWLMEKYPEYKASILNAYSEEVEEAYIEYLEQQSIKDEQEHPEHYL